MAFSINRVTLLGNVTRDPELKYTQGGTAICNLNIATNRSIKKGDDWEDVPSFHRIKVWGKLGEAASKFLSKGSKVYIEGRLQYGSYEKDGQKHYTTDIIASEVIGMSQGQGGQTSDEPPVESDVQVGDVEDIADDIPF